MAKTLPWRVARLLLIVVVVVCIFIVVQLTREVSKATNRLRAVQAASARGAKISYDWQFEDKMGPTEVKDFVREFSGNPALFAQVEHVDLTGSEFSDADLSLLESFDHAKWIIVGDCDVSDSGILALSRKLPQCRIRR
jgi:hypothetical protein